PPRRTPPTSRRAAWWRGTGSGRWRRGVPAGSGRWRSWEATLLRAFPANLCVSMRAVVTGANRGIGLELTRQLLARGDEVEALARDPDRARELHALRPTHG